MKTREFTLSTQELELDYNIDLNSELIEDYIFEELEVPENYVESMNIYDVYVNIKLSNSRKYFNEDWYVNLQRVSWTSTKCGILKYYKSRFLVCKNFMIF